MKLKYIAAAAALLASASTFAIQSSDTGNGGLFLVVTDGSLTTPESYDLDLSTLAGSVVSQIGNTSYSQTWHVADTNFSQFLADASNAGVSLSSLRWAVAGGGHSGAVTVANTNFGLTTVAAGQNVAATTNNALISGISNAGATGLSLFYSTLNNPSGINLPAGGSTIAQQGQTYAYFGNSNVSNLQDNWNKNTSFSQLNPVGASNVELAYLVNTPKKGSTILTTNNETALVASFTPDAAGGYDLTIASAVPEPDSLAMVLAGAAVVGLMVNRRRAA